MAAWQLIFLVFYAFFMAVGQIVLKLASLRINFKLPLAELIPTLIGNYFLWIGCAMYGFLMLSWVWIISIVPLNKAYPVAMLALFFTPIFSYFIFQEKLTAQYFIGIALMFVAIYLITT